ncbi:hypothetical protein [Halobacterium litoreum]|uniref:Uncharacterized protein n=1 Tax=Halobacterium litoreum TaxID=2039234 RepID=A0ABD5NED8_9EURY|nr:hypothetical protein [Halobacterium litoreum]UHH13580.1 hypothetical protein LT972_00955 [Halobacterium litoreum]
MPKDDFPVRLAAAMDEDGDGGDSLPKASAVVAGLLAPLRGFDKSTGGREFEAESADHAENRYAFTCEVGFGGQRCIARLAVYQKHGYVYARHGLHPTDSGGLLSRIRGRSSSYDALGVDPECASALAERRAKIVAEGVEDRVTTTRTTDDPVGFELRFETAATSMLTVTGFSDGRDYVSVPLPDLALRALVAERRALD